MALFTPSCAILNSGKSVSTRVTDGLQLRAFGQRLVNCLSGEAGNSESNEPSEETKPPTVIPPEYGKETRRY